ncbi:MAG: Holliday junction resolvase RuvX [bacterium]
MRILGIDYGEKYIGLALSDETQTIAYPFDTIFNGENVCDEIIEICKNENVGKIIVGVPIGFSGATKQTEINRKFISDLANLTPIPVLEENEILSTKMAEKRMKKGADPHQQSAVVILEGYLEKIK